MAHRDLAKKASDLEEANVELSQFAYAISHDIMTPLRAIHNYADFLREDLAGDPRREIKRCISTVSSARSTKVQELVEDLLELSRISGAARQFGTIDLGRFLHELIGFINLSADVQVVLGDDWPSIDAKPDVSEADLSEPYHQRN